MVLGPGFYHERSTVAVLARLRRGRPIPVPAGDVPVSYVSARDAAQGFVLAATFAGADQQAFNIAASDTPSVATFFEELAGRVGSCSQPRPVPRPVVRAGVAVARRAGRRRGAIGGTPVELLDFVATGGAYAIDKARRVLGYEPQDSCVDAWAALYDWWSDRPR
jgi:nucleoside-diphosphate-sugar epimerase